MPNSVIDRDLSSSVVTDCATATGASFTAVIPIETVATAESNAPSFTLKVNESVPFAFAFGVYVRFGAVPLSRPFVGAATTVYVRVFSSGSVPASVTNFATSSMTATDCATANGGSFLSCTTTATVATAESKEPSFTLKVKASTPT